MTTPFPILYEDNHLLVIDKPAGIATQGVTDGSSVNDLARAYLKQKYNKPGNVYLGIVSRLDTVTSGVLVLARTSKAASRLSQQIRDGMFVKRYQGVLEGSVNDARGTWTDHVRKDDAAHKMVVCESSHPEAKQATLQYEVLQRWRNRTLVTVELITGRKHQIRLQCAHRGHPIIGDRKYDATTRWEPGICLHSCFLSLQHPTKREPMEFESPPPDSWQRRFSR